MEIIFGLIGLCFLFVLFAGFIFLAIFLARKIGLLQPPEVSVDGEVVTQNYKQSISAYATDFKKLSDSLIFRFITIAVLIALMMLPLNMVGEVVAERSRLYQKVLNDISSTWGHQQNLQGPSLFIPYTEKFVTEEIKTDKDGNERKVNKTIYNQRTAIILPNDLDIDVNLNGESRKRSIYEALVYTADVTVSGDFKRPDIAKLSNHIDRIHWTGHGWLWVFLIHKRLIRSLNYNGING